jgi:hypothetical protein
MPLPKQKKRSIEMGPDLLPKRRLRSSLKKVQWTKCSMLSWALLLQPKQQIPSCWKRRAVHHPFQIVRNTAERTLGATRVLRCAHLRLALLLSSPREVGRLHLSNFLRKRSSMLRSSDGWCRKLRYSSLWSCIDVSRAAG